MPDIVNGQMTALAPHRNYDDGDFDAAVTATATTANSLLGDFEHVQSEVTRIADPSDPLLDLATATATNGLNLDRNQSDERNMAVPTPQSSDGGTSLLDRNQLVITETLIDTKPDLIGSKAEQMGVDDLFCKIGLDTWFQPNKLNPFVESLIYWRDVKVSGAVFGGVLTVLLSLTFYSLITVVAYVSLTLLFGAMSFRVFKSVMQAVQKTSDGHPFKEYLEADLKLSDQKAKEISDAVFGYANKAICELRRIFLVEDLIDSIKFAIFLWCLTYVGSWFNGLTVIILGFVSIFTLPKIYELNKTQIDHNIELAKTKTAEIASKIKAAVPLGKKPDDKRD